jgi:molecular chaperone DnaJ
MSKRDYYEILGVTKTVGKDELKKAYREQAMKYHPDRNPGDASAEEKFKEAAEAYEVLSDDEKRARYDRFGHQGVAGGPGGGYQNVDMNDIFDRFGDIFGDSPFASFFGGRAGGAREKGQRGSNLRIKAKLTLEDVANGVTKKIKVKKYVGCKTCEGTGARNKESIATCSTCKGSGFVRRVTNTFLGQMQTTSACPTCEGSGQTITAKCGSCRGDGRVYDEEVISIDIPAGAAEGMQFQLGGRGNAGLHGGRPGDLLISIEEEPHKDFIRDGNDIVYELHLNIADAALGHKADIPTLGSAVRLTVPAGTQSGREFVLKGKGLPVLQGYGVGDMRVYVSVWTPKELNDEERQMLEKLRQSPNFSPGTNKTEKGFFERMRNLFGGG